MLGWDASIVIGLRAMRLSAGGALADREATRMVVEKFTAAAELQAQWFTSALLFSPWTTPNDTVRHYRRKVSANRARLARARR